MLYLAKHGQKSKLKVFVGYDDFFDEFCDQVEAKILKKVINFLFLPFILRISRFTKPFHWKIFFHMLTYESKPIKF